MSDLVVIFDPQTHEAVREVVNLATGEQEWGESRDDRVARVETLIRALEQMDRPAIDALSHARDMHERHVNLLEGCPPCELEAAHQRDRLACNMCGEPLDPSQPFDGHRDCREQE